MHVACHDLILTPAVLLKKLQLDTVILSTSAGPSLAPLRLPTLTYIKIHTYIDNKVKNTPAKNILYVCMYVCIPDAMARPAGGVSDVNIGSSK